MNIFDFLKFYKRFSKPRNQSQSQLYRSWSYTGEDGIKHKFYDKYYYDQHIKKIEQEKRDFRNRSLLISRGKRV